MTTTYNHVTIIHAFDAINNEHYTFYYKGEITDASDIQDLLDAINDDNYYELKDFHHRNYNQFSSLIEQLEEDSPIFVLN